MPSRRYDINTHIQDAINQITNDTRHLTNSERTHYRADKAESITRFAHALKTLTLHQHNLALDPALTEDETYMRMVCDGYSTDIASWTNPLEVATLIQVASKKTRKEITTKYGHQVKHMQVTEYDPWKYTHKLTFTLNNGTTRTAAASVTTNLETAILENLRITGTLLRPHSDFTTRKNGSQYTLNLRIQTNIH